MDFGNPEPEYSNTRHNMGFDVINKIASKFGADISKNKFQALHEIIQIENQKVILVKPQTYMNSSGESVIKFKNFYKIENEKIIVIYDDMDLLIGDIKVRKQGSGGNHNGMKSIINNLNTESFCRIRIGIGRPKDKEEQIIDYVIGKIPIEEQLELDKATTNATNAVEEILKNGIDIAMNKFN